MNISHSSISIATPTFANPKPYYLIELYAVRIAILKLWNFGCGFRLSLLVTFLCVYLPQKRKTMAEYKLGKLLYS